MGLYTYPVLIAAKTTAGSIANWAADDGAPSAQILEEAQQRIYRRLRVRDMIGTATTGTITASQTSITLPSDYIAALMLQITGANHVELTRKTPNEVRATFQWDGAGVRTTGKPDLYYVDATTIQLDKPSDASYPYEMLYYSQPAMLSTSNTTNFLTDKCISALRSMCLSLVAEWKRKDDDRKYYDNRAEAEIAFLNVESDRELQGLLMSVEAE